MTRITPMCRVSLPPISPSAPTFALGSQYEHLQNCSLDTTMRRYLPAPAFSAYALRASVFSIGLVIRGSAAVCVDFFHGGVVIGHTPQKVMVRMKKHFLLFAVLFFASPITYAAQSMIEAYNTSVLAGR